MGRDALQNASGVGYGPCSLSSDRPARAGPWRFRSTIRSCPMREAAESPKKRPSLWSRFADIPTLIGLGVLLTLWVVLQ